MNTTTTNRPSRAALSISAAAVLASAAGSLAGPVLALDRQLKATLIDVQSIEAGSVTFLPIGAKNDKPQPVTKPLADFAAFLPPDVWTPGEDRPASWRASPAAGGAVVDWTAIDGAGAAVGVGANNRAASAAERSGLGIVELVDGQRLIGALDTTAEAAPADALVWSHRSIGQIVLPLDKVRRVRMEGPGIPMPDSIDTSQDIVLLGNGDTVSGLIEKITSTEVWSTPKGSGGKGDPIRTPLARVGEFRLANPPAVTSGPPHAMVWLEDGTVVASDAQSLSMGGESDRVLLGGIGAQIRAKPAIVSQTDVVPLGRLRALTTDSARFVPLSTLQVISQAPSADRLFGGPVIVGSGVDAPLAIADVLLPGPMRVEWTLPAGADRLAGWIELPEACRDWGACRVTLLIEGNELFVHNLSATESIVAFNVALPTGSGKPAAQRLMVNVESGERGPVQDQVLLRRVVVGVGASVGATGQTPAKPR